MAYIDEIVDEVRQVREKHAAKFDYDISAICKDIRLRQSKSGRRIVSRVTTKTGSPDEIRDDK